MTLNEAAASHARRDRAYSAHAIVAKRSHATTAQGITTKSSSVDEPHDASPSHKAGTNKKDHHHHHHHHGNRPRSKSCDLHRHAAPHKKKYPHHHNFHKHIPMHHLGRLSPTTPSSSAQPKLKGKMWIRPAAAMGAASFFPASLASVAPTPNGDDVGGGDVKRGTIRQVTDGSSPSAAAPFADDVVYGSPTSSFDSYLLGHPTSPPRIIFGESGKPLRPRAASFHHDPVDDIV